MSIAAASAPSVRIPVSDLFVSRDSVDSFMNGIRAAAIAFVPQWSGMSDKVHSLLTRALSDEMFFLAAGPTQILYSPFFLFAPYLFALIDWNASWQDEDAFKIDQISGGITNTLFKISRPATADGQPEARLKRSDLALEYMFFALPVNFFIARVYFHSRRCTVRQIAALVRVFGEKTELVIDRVREEALMDQLLVFDIGTPLFGRFSNGRVEHFLEGRSLTPDEMTDEVISPLVGAAMAKLHSVCAIFCCHIVGRMRYCS